MIKLKIVKKKIIVLFSVMIYWDNKMIEERVIYYKLLFKCKKGYVNGLYIKKNIWILGFCWKL